MGVAISLSQVIDDDFTFDLTTEIVDGIIRKCTDGCHDLTNEHIIERKLIVDCDMGAWSIIYEVIITSHTHTHTHTFTHSLTPSPPPLCSRVSCCQPRQYWILLYLMPLLIGVPLDQRSLSEILN